jgi:hypothetical protein
MTNAADGSILLPVEHRCSVFLALDRAVIVARAQGLAWNAQIILPMVVSLLGSQVAVCNGIAIVLCGLLIPGPQYFSSGYDAPNAAL